MSARENRRDECDQPCFTASDVERALDLVRPAIRRDGGDIELVAIEGANVRVQLTGACTSCPSSTTTLRFGVEKTLREELAGFGELFADAPRAPERLGLWRRLVGLGAGA